MKGFVAVTDNDWFACVTLLKQNKKGVTCPFDLL